MGLIYSTANFVPGDGRGVIVRISGNLQRVVEHGQAIVKQEAEALVPVDTGELFLSISAPPVVDTGELIIGEVVASAPHAGFLEFGTGIRGASSINAGPYPYNMDWLGINPQPYLRPALDLARDRIREQLRR